MDKKTYDCTQSHGRDVLQVRPSEDNVIFRTGFKAGGLDGVNGLDVYVSVDELPELIAQLQGYVPDEPEPIEYKEVFECAYTEGENLIVEHTRFGILPQFQVEANGKVSDLVFVTEPDLLRLRDLIDLSLEKIEAEGKDFCD